MCGGACRDWSQNVEPPASHPGDSMTTYGGGRWYVSYFHFLSVWLLDGDGRYSRWARFLPYCVRASDHCTPAWACGSLRFSVRFPHVRHTQVHLERAVPVLSGRWLHRSRREAGAYFFNEKMNNFDLDCIPKKQNARKKILPWNIFSPYIKNPPNRGGCLKKYIILKEDPMKNEKYKTSSYYSNRKCQHPCHKNTFDRIELQSMTTMLIGACSCNTGWHNMGCRNRESNIRRCANSKGCNNGTSSCLSEIQFFTSDLFPDGHNDPFPTDHRTETEREWDHEDNPEWCIIRCNRECTYIICDIFKCWCCSSGICLRDECQFFRRKCFIVFLDSEDVTADIFSVNCILFYDFWLEITYILFEFCSDAGVFCLERVYIYFIDLKSDFYDIIIEIFHIKIGIDRECRREKCHENKENKSDSLLTIISTMFIADPCARDNENESIPEIGIFMGNCSRYLECSFISSCYMMKNIHESKCYTKSNKWREEEWFSCIECFPPTWRVTSEIPDSYRDTEYRSDKCMRWWCGNTEIPCPEIPDDGCDQEGEYYTESVSQRGWGDSLKRKKMNNTHCYCDSSNDHSSSIHNCSKDYWMFWFESIGINNGGNSICRVMESINEFECTDE